MKIRNGELPESDLYDKIDLINEELELLYCDYYHIDDTDYEMGKDLLRIIRDLENRKIRLTVELFNRETH